jgi:fluoroacetyl-CoA thioesterase
VLATPRVVALAEQAPVAAVAGALEAGATTVGVQVELDHLAPARPVPTSR